MQDEDKNGDDQSDVFMNSWDYRYRDVVIVNSQGIPVDTYNLTDFDLRNAANRATMLQKLVDAANNDNLPNSWTNPDDPLDVSGDGEISPLDSLLVINELNQVGAHELSPPDGTSAPPPYLDSSNDGFVSPIDALLVLNHLNANSNGGTLSFHAVAAAFDEPAEAEASRFEASDKAVDQLFDANDFKLDRLALLAVSALDADDDLQPFRRSSI